MAVELGSKPCLDPISIWQMCREHGLPIEPWFGKVNQFRCLRGQKPGYGHVLMLRRDVDALDVDTQLTLRFQEPDEPYPQDRGAAGQTYRRSGHDVTLKGIIFVKSECILPGVEGLGTLPHVVWLEDRRRLYETIPIDTAYNVRQDNATGYYNGTTNSGAAWTWTTMIQNIWTTQIGKLGTWPGLPFTPTGTPEDYFFWGQSAWDALGTVLSHIGCELAFDPTLDTFSIVRVGTVSTAEDTAVTKWKGVRVWDTERQKSILGNAPEKVRVHFPKRPIPKDKDSSLWYTVDKTDTTSTGKETGTYALLYDNIPALYDSTNTLTNSSALDARAVERAADYFRILNMGDAHRVYGATIPDAGFLPGSRIAGTLWEDRGTGYKTEFIRGADVEFKVEGKPGCCGSETGNELVHVRLATIEPLPTYTFSSDTYTASANGALVVDGKTVALNDEILILYESNQARNGPVSVAQVGSGTTPYILRYIPQPLTGGQLHPVGPEGTTYGCKVFKLNTPDPITRGTTPLNYVPVVPQPCCDPCLKLPTSGEALGISLQYQSPSSTSAGYLYALSEGASPSWVTQLRLSDRFRSAALQLATGEFPASASAFNPDLGLFYAGLNKTPPELVEVKVGNPGLKRVRNSAMSGGSGLGAVKYNPNTGTLIVADRSSPGTVRYLEGANYNGATSINVANAGGSNYRLRGDIDTRRGYGYWWADGAKLERYTLGSSFALDPTSRTLASPVTSVLAVTHSSDHRYAYAVCQGSSNTRLVKVDLANMSESLSVEQSGINNGNLSSITLDESSGQIGVAWETAGNSQFRKFDTTSLATSGAAITLESGAESKQVTDASPLAINGHAYVCNQANSVTKVKFNALGSDPEKVGVALTLSGPGADVPTGFIGSDSSNMYFAMQGSVFINKVSISSFTVTGTYSHSANVNQRGNLLLGDKILFVGPTDETLRVLLTSNMTQISTSEAMPNTTMMYLHGPDDDGYLYAGFTGSAPDTIYRLQVSLTQFASTTWTGNSYKALGVDGVNGNVLGGSTNGVASVASATTGVESVSSALGGNEIAFISPPPDGSYTGSAFAFDYATSGASTFWRLNVTTLAVTYSVPLINPMTGANIGKAKAGAFVPGGEYIVITTDNSPYEVVVVRLSDGKIMAAYTAQAASASVSPGENQAQAVAYDTANNYFYALTYTTPTQLCRYELCCLLGTGSGSQINSDDIFQVRNESGSNYGVSTIIKKTGASGGIPLVTAADNSAEATMPADGMLLQTIPTGSNGYAIRRGRITGINTSVWGVAGDTLWVGTGGDAVNAVPTASLKVVQRFGTILVASTTVGVLDVDFVGPEKVNYAASRLSGRGSAAGAGSLEPITIGAGLSMAGTALSATGSSPAVSDFSSIFMLMGA